MKTPARAEKPKARYGISVRHRFSFDTDAESLYRRAVAVLSRLDPPWGLKDMPIKPLPTMRANPGVGVGYTRELKAPIRVFWLGFKNRQLRAEPDDSPWWDDTLMVDFSIDHPKVDYAHLVQQVIPVYVEAMDAYRVDLREENVASLDLNALSRSPPPDLPVDVGNYRKYVNRIWAANYWDRQLCNRAFGLTPEHVAERLKDHVAESRILRNGVLVVYSAQRVPDDQLAGIHDKLAPLLRRHASEAHAV